MSYSDEKASKSSHSNIIQDPFVKEYLGTCELPKIASDVNKEDMFTFELPKLFHNPIQHVVTVDGGYSEASVKKEFPSSSITFFQFGLLSFSILDLVNLEEKPFISPKDMRKLKEINRLKFILPTKNIKLKGQETLTDSVESLCLIFLIKFLKKRILLLKL